MIVNISKPSQQSKAMNWISASVPRQLKLTHIIIMITAVAIAIGSLCYVNNSCSLFILVFFFLFSFPGYAFVFG